MPSAQSILHGEGIPWTEGLGGSQFLCAEPVKILDITSGPRCADTVNMHTGTRTYTDAYTHVHARTHTSRTQRGKAPQL